MTLNKISTKWGERAAIIGKTNSGKTFLAQKLLNDFQYVVVLDSKGTINWTGYKIYRSLKQLVKAREDKLIYRPNIKEVRDEKIIDAFFFWVYERQRTCLYIDEVFAVVSGNSIPDGYHACLTRGRERDITLISSTQRPKRIPQEILSEAENLYIFKLRLENDRDKIEEIIGDTEENLIKNLPNRYFIYCNYDDIYGPFTIKEI